MRRAAAYVVAAVLLASCKANRSPEDARQTFAPRQYQFSQTAPTVRNCILPGLDLLEPFSLQPGLTRPTTVRDLGERIEIFAQDESITLYTIDLSTAGKQMSRATAYAGNASVISQIDEILRRCGGA